VPKIVLATGTNTLLNWRWRRCSDACRFEGLFAWLAALCISKRSSGSGSNLSVLANWVVVSGRDQGVASKQHRDGVAF